MKFTPVLSYNNFIVYQIDDSDRYFAWIDDMPIREVKLTHLLKEQPDGSLIDTFTGDIYKADEWVFGLYPCFVCGELDRGTDYAYFEEVDF